MKIEEINLKIMGKIISEYLIYFHFIYFYSRSLSWTTLVKSPTDTPLFWIATPLTLPASSQRSKRSVTVVPVSRGGFGTWDHVLYLGKMKNLKKEVLWFFCQMEENYCPIFYRKLNLYILMLRTIISINF